MSGLFLLFTAFGILLFPLEAMLPTPTTVRPSIEEMHKIRVKNIQKRRAVAFSEMLKKPVKSLEEIPDRASEITTELFSDLLETINLYKTHKIAWEIIRDPNKNMNDVAAAGFFALYNSGRKNIGPPVSTADIFDAIIAGVNTVIDEYAKMTKKRGKLMLNDEDMQKFKDFAFQALDDGLLHDGEKYPPGAFARETAIHIRVEPGSRKLEANDGRLFKKYPLGVLTVDAAKLSAALSVARQHIEKNLIVVRKDNSTLSHESGERRTRSSNNSVTHSTEGSGGASGTTSLRSVSRVD